VVRIALFYPSFMSDSSAATGPRPRALVIVPAFNEAGSIAQVVREVREHAPMCDVVVIDDGSIDDTALNVPADAVLLRLPFNLGIGNAMQTGYRYAARHDYDFAVQVDADGQHPAEVVPRLLEHLEQTGDDMVIGSRFLEAGGYAQSFARMTGIRMLNTLIRLLTGSPITDCTSGFRASGRAVIEAFAHWYPDDYPEPEVVLLLRRAGFRVSEVPTHMRQRQTGQTSIPLSRGLFYVAKVVFALILDTMRQPWPTRKEAP